jgi:hypothetical protein
MPCTSPGFQHEKTWVRISTGFRTGMSRSCKKFGLGSLSSPGHCVCTVGTGRQGRRWSGIDLPASHCYAVIGELRYHPSLHSLNKFRCGGARRYPKSIDFEHVDVAFDRREHRYPTCPAPKYICLTLHDVGLSLSSRNP